jgi:uncharacterized membrane protein YdbT with pleckstrin-like domain
MEEFPLDAGERVTRTVRKHWFVLVVSLVPYALLAWLPAVLPQFLAGIVPLHPETAAFLLALTSENRWFRLFLGLWWLTLWIAAFNAFTQYYLNHWVITTARIVRIRQKGFFNREVSSFLLAKVQDVSTTVDGILADLLGFGSVRVETAGDASRHFVMDGIENPTGMRDLIMSQIAALHIPKDA